MSRQRLSASRKSKNAYVVFTSQAQAELATSCNGALFEDHHVRVDLAERSKVHANDRSVFVGNLPFDVEEEELHQAFAECGAVESVRVVRDPATNIGKGFGYVIFTSRGPVSTALLLNDLVDIRARKLRVMRVHGDRRPPTGPRTAPSDAPRRNRAGKSARPGARQPAELAHVAHRSAARRGTPSRPPRRKTYHPPEDKEKRRQRRMAERERAAAVAAAPRGVVPAG